MDSGVLLVATSWSPGMSWRGLLLCVRMEKTSCESMACLSSFTVELKMVLCLCMELNGGESMACPDDSQLNFNGCFATDISFTISTSQEKNDPKLRRVHIVRTKRKHKFIRTCCRNSLCPSTFLSAVTKIEGVRN